MRRPRVLHVITDTDRRGAQVFAWQLSQHPSQAGAQLVALTSGRTSEQLDVVRLGPRRLHPVTLRRLRQRARHADVVVGHGSSALVASAVALLGLPTRFVYRQISDQRFWAGSGARRLRVQAYLRSAHAVVALWSGAAQTLSDLYRVPADRVHVVPNGVVADGFRPAQADERDAARSRLGLRDDQPVVLSIGALAPEKGVDLAIEAVAGLADVQLLVVGAGPEETRLRELAERRAPGRVRFHPPLPDPQSAFAAADVVVLASRGGDSMPGVLIEAGLCGLPATATRVEGIVEIVLDGVTGALVEPTPEQVQEGLQRCLRDKAAWGAAARAHCSARFTMEPVAAAWDRVLREVATQQPGDQPDARWAGTHRPDAQQEEQT